MLFDITYMWNQKKKKTDTNEIIYKTEMDSQTENKPMVTKVQRVGRSTGHLDRERNSVCVCMCVCVITQDELGKRNSFIYPWEGHHKTWWSLLASCCYPLPNQVNLYQGWDSRINTTGQTTCSDEKSLINNWFRVHVCFFFNKILRHYQLSVHLVWPVATTPYPGSPPLG